MAQGSSNPTQDLRKIGGISVDTNTGNASTGTQRVVLATNQPSIPVTGTFWQATQPVSIASWTGLTDTQLRASAVPVSLATVPTHAVTQSGTWNVGLSAGSNAIGSITNTSFAATQSTASSLLNKPYGAVTTSAPTYTTGTDNALSLTTTGALRIDGSGVTQPVSGTVAATQSGTWNIGSVTSITNTVAVSGPLTDTQLRATAVPVSGTISVNALPAGTNNIGDVDVASLPGTVAADITAIKTATESLDDAVGSDGAAVSIGMLRVGGTDGTNNQTMAVTTSGHVIVNDGGTTLSIDDGGGAITVDGTVAVTDNAGSLTVDAPVGTPVFVRLSDGAAAISTLPVSLASVPSHAVTNAGTFAVQIDGSALTSLQLLDDVVATDGAAATTKLFQVGGTDGTNAQILSTNTSGHLNISDGGNSITVDGTFWQATQPVSIAAAVAVTDNAGSLTVDAPVTTPVFVRLSDGATAITALPVTDNGGSITVDGTFWQATQPVSLASVPSHPVTNAGTFAVQVSSALPAGTNAIGSITNTSFAATQSGTWTVQPGNTANTTPWLTRPAEQLGTATALGALNANISQALLGNTGIAAVITATATPSGIVLTPQVSYDGGTNWVDSKFFDPASETAFTTLSTFTVGTSYAILASDGATHARVIATSWTSGSVTVRLSATNSSNIVSLLSGAEHDAGSGTFVQMIGGYASSTAPTAVSANGDAVRLWATTSGALNIADGGSTISIDDNGGSITVDGTVAVTGTFWQATQPVSGTVTANQGGTWNITNISGTVSLPTGAATAANQATEITALQLLDDAVGTSGTAVATGMYRVGGTDGTNNRLLSVNTSGHVNIADGGNSITVDGSVSVSNFPATQTISGTVSVNALPTGTNSIGNIGTVSTVTSLSQLAGAAINLGAGTTGTGTLRTIEAGAATGTQTNPSLSNVSATLLAANTARRGASVFNNSTAIVYIRLSATAASTTTFTIKLQPDDYYEVPSYYNGAITAILSVAGPLTTIQVTEIT